VDGELLNHLFLAQLLISMTEFVMLIPRYSGELFVIQKHLLDVIKLDIKIVELELVLLVQANAVGKSLISS